MDSPDLNVRQLIDRALMRVDDGSPRALIRVNLLNALKRIDDSRHRYRCRPGCFDCDLRDEPIRANDVRVAIVDDPEEAHQPPLGARCN